MKRFLTIILTFMMVLSFSSQVFASENKNSATKSKTNSDVQIIIDSNSKVQTIISPNDPTQNSGSGVQAESFEINIPNWVRTYLKFTSMGSFTVSTNNIGISSLTSVYYRMEVYDTNNKLQVIRTDEAGPVSPLWTVTNSYSYPSVNIGKVVITVTSRNSYGSTQTSTGTAYR